MADRTLTFATSLQPDPALRQDARYRFDGPDRQSIDNQIRSAQTFLSKDVLNGVSATYVPFVGDDGAVGDVVCSAGGLNGKPTVTLATTSALATSGVMFGILVEACVEGNRAHVAYGGILGPEVTGLDTGDEGWVRVSSNRCEKVAVLADEDICVGWVDSGGFLRVGSQPIASVTGASPTNAKYLIAASSVPAELTQAIAAQGLSSTFIFASTSVAPLEMRRTDAATNADVDVGYLEALSSSTTAAGFGPALRFYAKKGSGGAETLGTISLAWTNVSGGSEASKFVVKTRSAGGAAAAALEVSETAITATALAGVGTRFVTVTSGGVLGSAAATGADSTAKYLTDASSAVNTNDVPIRATPSTIEFASTAATPLGASRGATQATSGVQTGYDKRTVTDASGHGTTGTAVYRSFYLPDGAGASTEAARLTAVWSSILGPYADLGIDVATNPGGGGLLRAMTISGGGNVRLHGSAYAHDGYRLVLDGSGNLSASVVSFAEVKTALAAADSAVTIDDDLIVTGDLTVSGTTTTVDSTTVNLADRLIVFNSSTGTVPVPVDIAGFVIDRGSADGVTKRDMPGLLWDETNSRFDLANNTAGDQSTIGSFVGLKLAALTVSGFSSGFVRSNGSGVLSSSALASGDVTGALGYTPLQGSGTTNALPRYTASTTLGDSGITDDGTTVNTARVVTYTCDNAGSTQARGVTIVNNTVSGTQYTKHHGFTAFHSGGTQWNIGSRLEVVNASHARLIWYYGSGSGAPSSEALRIDTQDDNFGTFVRGPVFAVSSYSGFRFDFNNNRGGLKQDSGSDYIYLESYNGKDLRFRTGADSGGSGGVDRLTITGTGTVTATWSCPVIGKTFTSTPVSSADASSLTIDLSTGLHQIVPLTLATTAITMSNARAGTRYLVHVEQDATGGRAVTWTDTIAWGTVSSSPDTTAQHFTIWELYCYTTTPGAKFIALARNADNIP